MKEKKNFEGTARDLMRMNYLKTTYECPENGVGDKYFMHGNFEQEKSLYHALTKRNSKTMFSQRV